MSDELDRAVDARIDAYRPDILPPFTVIEGRRRARDRRRMAVGAGALSVAAVAAGALVVPGLLSGGDRLTTGQPAEPVALTQFTVRYASVSPSEGRTGAIDAALGRCLALPGARDDVGLAYSDPPVWAVTVEGTAAQAANVRDCLAGLPDAKVETVPDEATGDQTRTFRVSSDGSASPDAYTDAVEKCLALPGVTGSSVQESNPATYEMRASGTAADALAECLASAPGARVEETGNDDAGGVDVDAFINRCVGGENPRPAPEYVGLTEDEATRTKQPESADSINAVRVVGRDGECLGRTRDLRYDRVNLLIADGKVLWAGRF